jgi:hypothetical protein
VILTETIFLGGVPMGVVRQDTNTRQIDFSPLKGKSPLPKRRWSSVDELTAAVIATYSRKEKSPPGLTSGPSYPLDEDFANHANRKRPD